MNNYTVRPKIGDFISVGHAEFLSAYYDLPIINERLRTSPKSYIGFHFNGCTGVPDPIFEFVAKGGWENITYECCLAHDLSYSYGDPGNEKERKIVDKRFKNDLKKYLDWWAYTLMYSIVRMVGGSVYAKKNNF